MFRSKSAFSNTSRGINNCRNSSKNENNHKEQKPVKIQTMIMMKVVFLVSIMIGPAFPNLYKLVFIFVYALLCISLMLLEKGGRRMVGEPGVPIWRK